METKVVRIRLFGKVIGGVSGVDDVKSVVKCFSGPKDYL